MSTAFRPSATTQRRWNPAVFNRNEDKTQPTKTQTADKTQGCGPGCSCVGCRSAAAPQDVRTHDHGHSHNHARAHEHRSSGVKPTSGSAADVMSSHALLREGSSGGQVLMLKQQLRNAGFDPGSGRVFDAQTADAVRKYQAANGLQVDGIVGQQTWGKMYGFDLEPGSSMLKNGSSSSASQVAASHNHDHGPADKHVAGYVNGQMQQIGVSSIGDGYYMRSDAAASYIRMREAAARDGITLNTSSAFRTQEQQQHLWDKYQNGTGNLAARPGHSNHQGGLSVDIGGLGGYESAGYKWLSENAGQFGFVNDVAGEPWHWTFQG